MKDIDQKQTKTQQTEEQSKQQSKQDYSKPSMTEHEPLERATTTVYYFYEY